MEDAQSTVAAETTPREMREADGSRRDQATDRQPTTTIEFNGRRVLAHLNRNNEKFHRQRTSEQNRKTLRRRSRKHSERTSN